MPSLMKISNKQNKSFLRFGFAPKDRKDWSYAILFLVNYYSDVCLHPQMLPNAMTMLNIWRLAKQWSAAILDAMSN